MGKGGIPQTWPTPPKPRGRGDARPGPGARSSPSLWAEGPAPAYLTGSRHRLNKLQQLAIRLNIPGLSSRHLPSEPRAGKGPELRGPAQGPHVSRLPWGRPARRTGGDGCDRDRPQVRPLTASARRPRTARPNTGSGTPERR